MTVPQRKSRAAEATADAAGQVNEATEDYDPVARKARLTKSDVARRLSIWLDKVYDNDAVPASGFKLTYRIAKRCRATFAKEGKLHSFEGKESLAASAGISQKQVGNLLNILVKQGLIQIIRRGKGLTNLLVPVLSDGQYSSDHIGKDDRQSISDQDDDVTGNTFPSDRKSISRLTGNEFPVHIDEGLERRVVAEGGEGFQPSPSSSSSSNTLSSENGSDAHESASGQGDLLRIGDEIEVGQYGACVVDDFGRLGRTNFVRARRVSATHIIILIPVARSGDLAVDEAGFEDEFRAEEFRSDNLIECRLPARPGRKSDAA